MGDVRKMSKLGKKVMQPTKVTDKFVMLGDVKVAKSQLTAAQLAKYAVKGVVALLMFALMFVPIIGKIGASKLGMLYLIGDNGLKSGRASGNVYLRNGRVRQFRVPRLVRNANTSTVRATFALFSSTFRSLTSDEIAAWNSFKATASDRFGRTIIVTGKQAYIRLNALLASVFSPAITVPPVSIPSPTPTEDVVILTNTTSVLRLSYTDNPEGATTQLWATPQLSAGVSRPGQSQFRLIGIIDTTTGGVGLAVTTAYEARFGALVAGGQIFVQMKVVDGSFGLASAITQSVGSVTT